MLKQSRPILLFSFPLSFPQDIRYCQQSCDCINSLNHCLSPPERNSVSSSSKNNSLLHFFLLRSLPLLYLFSCVCNFLFYISVLYGYAFFRLRTKYATANRAAIANIVSKPGVGVGVGGKEGVGVGVALGVGTGIPQVIFMLPFGMAIEYLLPSSSFHHL